ncbi:hypothetical protein ACFX13_008724 [Malus domestica]
MLWWWQLKQDCWVFLFLGSKLYFGLCFEDPYLLLCFSSRHPTGHFPGVDCTDQATGTGRGAHTAHFRKFRSHFHRFTLWLTIRLKSRRAPSRPIFFIDPTRPDPTPPSSQRRHDYHGNYEPAIHLFLFVFFCWVFVLMICS